MKVPGRLRDMYIKSDMESKMAKLQFENKFIMTRKLHAQYCKYCYQKMRKRLQVMSGILSLICFVLAILGGVLLHSSKVMTVFLCFSLYFLLTVFWGYKFSEWLNFRKLTEDHGGEAVVMIVKFFSDQVRVQVNQSAFSFKYDSIVKGCETEDLLILILGIKGTVEQGQVVYKGNFNGEEKIKEFKEYINRRTDREIFEQTKP